ncbi:NACalpha-BTF3-like transcription factor [Clostridiales Family XIII bacterium PM5-7]
MEITLEKIELVKDRTGVTYKEAKEALEASEGNVVDAIIAIEETIDQKPSKKIGVQGEALIEKMKEVVKKGNISKIIVTRDGETLINIPLTVGVLGTVVAPWGMIAGVVAAFGFKCKIEFVKEDGSIIDLSEKAEDLYEDAKEKGADIYEDLKEKAPGVYEDIKEMGTEAFYKAKDAAKDAKERFSREYDFDDDIDMDDIIICEKDCNVCEEPCEEKCDDCKSDQPQNDEA